VSVRGGKMEGRFEPIEQLPVSGHEPRVHERHQEFRVVDFELAELLNLAHLVADHETEIPERMQNRADDAFFLVAEAAAEEQ
jgi:hypothetical protein